jgi:ribonuclease R
MIHISSLTDDFYVLNAGQRQLIGRQSRRRFSVGDELRVYVARVDVFKRQVDFAIVEEKPAKRRREEPAREERKARPPRERRRR